ncbi:NUDIX hydrolase [Clostridium cellulovorans]|uniref:NUDIX hydrolase n=1 Tax=Clostridium cellulovorans (strain ATCC 35296 / DSM 3052 / OCM 3 / 743B) TaxID=573061 RepID=D9SVP4_CLOC7|nr:NUDIX hydrolase [Clostridium cellulovorans]ADL53105.1 NUDIX hydrolase [Clostridium cellulovorans 743B]
MSYQWIEYARRVQALAQIGLANCNNPYDIERYEELRDISVKLMATYSDTEIETVRELFARETGYQTPKTVVRSVVFKDGKVLMVQEKADYKWALPGGWSDIGYTPGEVAAKETFEEAGIKVKPVKLLAVFDRSKHPHLPTSSHVYNIFIQCEMVEGEIKPGLETNDVGFFDRNSLPTLSTARITEDEMEIIFQFLDDENKAAVFD